MSQMKDSLIVFQEGARVNFQLHGHLVPVFAAVLDGEPQLMAVVWNNAAEKDMFAKRIQQWIAEGRVTEYMMVVECWVTQIREDQRDEVRRFLQTHGSLESWPNRQEMVMVTYCSPHEEIEFTAPINRGIIPPDLGEWKKVTRQVSFNLDDFSARFQGLFLKAKAGLN